MKNQLTALRRQAGVTLMELIAVLAVIATIVVGALSLFGSADSSQKSTQMVQEVSALRAAIKTMYLGQAGFGATAGTLKNDLLVTANKVPSTIAVDKTTDPDKLTHALGGTYTITNTDNTHFTITITAVPTAVCVAVLTGLSSGWDSVAVAGRTAVNPPVTPTTAATECGTAATNSIVYTGS